MIFPPAFGDNLPRSIARLTERHKHVIEPNRPWIEGKRVLDLAASNGRWSWAATQARAAGVVAVEGRADRIEDGKSLVGPNVCYVHDDIFDFLWKTTESFDTIFCLGVFYHVADHHMLLKLMARREPDCIIIDSGFVPSFDWSTRYVSEEVDLYANAIREAPEQERAVIGQISIGLLIEWANGLGYRTEPVTWLRRDIDEPETVRDYLRGRRFTVRLLRGRDGQDERRWRDTIQAMGLNIAKIIDEPLAARRAFEADEDTARGRKYERAAAGQF